MPPCPSHESFPWEGHHLQVAGKLMRMTTTAEESLPVICYTAHKRSFLGSRLDGFSSHCRKVLRQPQDRKALQCPVCRSSIVDVTSSQVYPILECFSICVAMPIELDVSLWAGLSS